MTSVVMSWHFWHKDYPSLPSQQLALPDYVPCMEWPVELALLLGIGPPSYFLLAGRASCKNMSKLAVSGALAWKEFLVLHFHIKETTDSGGNLFFLQRINGSSSFMKWKVRYHQLLLAGIECSIIECWNYSLIFHWIKWHSLYCCEMVLNRIPYYLTDVNGVTDSKMTVKGKPTSKN